MFLENINQNTRSKGWIEVICGSMFSGKTEELIRRLKRAKLANQKVEIFKPINDTRYHSKKIISHQGNEINSTPVHSSANILLLTKNVDVVGIDEAQFFDLELINICKHLADNGVRVIVAGLDMDFKGQPFGPIPVLLANAEYITKVHAICMHCGNLAYISYRTSIETDLVLLGEKDKYKPLCRNCYNDVNKDKK